MPVRLAAVFRAAIRQYAAQRNALLLETRKDPIIQQIGRCDRRLRIELREADLRVRVDEGLRVDSTDALQRTDVKGVLRPAVPGALALEFAVRFLVAMHALKRRELRLAQKATVLRDFASSAFSRCFIVARSWRTQTHRTPAAEIVRPCFASSLATRCWPHAGWSIAMATIAPSKSLAMRLRRFGFRRLISRSASSPPVSYSSLNR
jgi:hypothetical protein